MSNKAKLIGIVISFILLLYASILDEGNAFNPVIIILLLIGLKDCITTLVTDLKYKKSK
ncbi:hypothetical protein [Paraclostridium tenue]|uniref:Uncharacterized protein n=1 Tax=Paraclostridium tenue TaxID=1737 RepID=A0ABP3XJP5_9FIRM